MKNNICYINGVYLTEKVSGGAKRFSSEMVSALQNAQSDVKFVVLCPKDAVLPSNGGAVEYRTVGKFTGNLWEQISLPRYVNRRRGLLLSLCNSYPAFAKRNLVTVFDVRPKEELNEGKSSRFLKKFDFLMRRAKKRGFPLLTISDFTKERIVALYGIDPSKIGVVRCGHEHCLKTDQGVAPPQGEYYLSVSSVSSHKNFDFILRLAALHPGKRFYIVGNRYDELTAPVPENVTFLGKLSDSALAAYYRGAKAFFSPSLYEGFGLTPLEAICYGCPTVYLSDIPVFREVFGTVGSFFDAHDVASFSFENAHTVTIEERENLLNNYSWENGASDVIRAVGQAFSGD